MNRDRVLAWIEALESGTYQQTTGVLRDASGFCALGVACDASGVGAWDGALYIVGDEQGFAVLPPSVQAFYRITHDVEAGVAKRNDMYSKSFAEIAAYLREQLAREEQTPWLADVYDYADEHRVWCGL